MSANWRTGPRPPESQLQRIAEIELAVTRVSLQIRHAMLVKTPSDLTTTLADIGSKRKHIDETFAAFEKSILTSAGKEAFARFAPLASEFWRTGVGNIHLIETGQKDEAFSMLVNATIPARNQLLAALDAENREQGNLLLKS